MVIAVLPIQLRILSSTGALGYLITSAECLIYTVAEHHPACINNSTAGAMALLAPSRYITARILTVEVNEQLCKRTKSIYRSDMSDLHSKCPLI
jgi:hypothetical protein